jgi:SNF2 family DNA or RNA helicase
VRRLEKEIKEKKFRVVIADESHLLKNYKTERTKAILPILKVNLFSISSFLMIERLLTQTNNTFRARKDAFC